MLLHYYCLPTLLLLLMSCFALGLDRIFTWYIIFVQDEAFRSVIDEVQLQHDQLTAVFKYVYPVVLLLFTLLWWY
jgi:hypothetical protein